MGPQGRADVGTPVVVPYPVFVFSPVLSIISSREAVGPNLDNSSGKCHCGGQSVSSHVTSTLDPNSTESADATPLAHRSAVLCLRADASSSPHCMDILQQQ
ncbi:unnamed protein product [Lampetra planeri]